MAARTVPEAWVTMPPETEVRKLMSSPDGSANPYDFGFLPAMARLIAAHPGIGPAFALLFGQIMFAPGVLDRRERELVAAVAAGAQDCHY